MSSSPNNCIEPAQSNLKGIFCLLMPNFCFAPAITMNEVSLCQQQNHTTLRKPSRYKQRTVIITIVNLFAWMMLIAQRFLMMNSNINHKSHTYIYIYNDIYYNIYNMIHFLFVFFRVKSLQQMSKDLINRWF